MQQILTLPKNIMKPTQTKWLPPAKTQEAGKATYSVESCGRIVGASHVRSSIPRAAGELGEVVAECDGLNHAAMANQIADVLNSHAALMEVSRAAKAMRHYGRLGDSRGERAAGEQLDEALATLNRNA